MYHSFTSKSCSVVIVAVVEVGGACDAEVEGGTCDVVGGACV